MVDRMAQVNKSGISLGSGRTIGSMSVDGGMIRGVGGPVRPQLVVPLTIQMNPMQEESTLAVCSLSAMLSTDMNALPHQMICQPISKSLVPNFYARSIPHGPHDHRVELRFFLTLAEVEDVELRRHAAGGDVFTLYLGLEVVVAGLRNFNTYGPGQAPEPTPWDVRYGIFSDVRPFWTAQVSPVWVQIEQSTWVRDVLPGLGHDRVRLIEMTLPPPLPEHTSAAAQFDRARRALDERRYGACISECRGLLNMWELQLRATSKRRVAEVVGDDRSWPAGDIRRGLLDVLWKEVGDVASAPHHPEGNVDAELFGERDARLVLLLTAALSEYVAPR
jgi:hypothetical protein